MGSREWTGRRRALTVLKQILWSALTLQDTIPFQTDRPAFEGGPIGNPLLLSDGTGLSNAFRVKIDTQGISAHQITPRGNHNATITRTEIKSDCSSGCTSAMSSMR